MISNRDASLAALQALTEDAHRTRNASQKMQTAQTLAVGHALLDIADAIRETKATGDEAIR